MAAAADQLLTFELAGRRLALPATLVREVVRRGRLTPVPQAPPSLLGLANVRGHALPVLSCAALLDVPPGPAGSVIILAGAVPVGLAVDRVREVLHGNSVASGGTIPDALDVLPLIARHFGALSARPARRGERIAARRARDAGKERSRILCFTVGGQHFALMLSAVEAAIAVPATIAALPHADAATIGTMAWRDGVLPLFSLAALLGLASARGAIRRRVIVVRVAGHRVGFVVDAIGGVLTIDDSAVDPLPPVLARGGAEARIAGVVRMARGELVSLLVPDQLLDETLVAGLATTAVDDVKAVAQTADATEALLLLVIAGQRYALPLAAVDEIARVPAQLTRLPRAPDFVRGAMNVRGRALALIDQARQFGTVAQGQRVVIARSDVLEAAFLVEQILGVITVPAHALVAAPAVGSDPQLFEAVLIDGEDAPLTLLLSPFALLDGTERAILAALGEREAAQSL